LFPLDLNVTLGFASENRETKVTHGFLRASHKKPINIVVKVKINGMMSLNMSFRLLISGTPDNGLQFYVVHAKNVCHQECLISLPTGANWSIESALHEEEPFIKRLEKSLTSVCAVITTRT